MGVDRGFNTITSSLKVSPISEPEFDILFSPILVKDVSQIAVGVSGGPDSLALSWLLHRWCEQIGIRLIALTVDHRLRPNSSKDARNVFLWLKSWGLNCIILPWVGNKPSTGIQETARIARYKLMIDWCIENGVRDLALAHHQEDQAETFLMRLSRGSGIDGLACMREVTLREGVRLLRPLLTVPKSRLRATLKSQNQEWLEDPANSNPAFTRTLIRDLSILLSEREVGTQRLAHLSEQFGRIRVRLEELTRLVVDRAAIIHSTGWATINGELLIHLPDEIGRRVMIFLLQSIGGRSYPPRRKRLDRIMTFIKDPDHCTAFSLGGCSISRQDHQFTILREELRQTAASPIFFAGSVM
ncbi:MAG TPA: tRNA lysidine(34) synthetase TilS, partial [Rhodospirillales bacterium]|nr:tRNA lysidine(34) synthetase TilS [Rhodospirillales bacterium]